MSERVISCLPRSKDGRVLVMRIQWSRVFITKALNIYRSGFNRCTVCTDTL